ncbi:hypothetical protein CRENBAI_017802 [Crenichthys baileyi]|uniref:Uncharacterized protein n=1 Tax=Crenichthys baileyi TaxID=28760 RepID=A0AAV9SPC8_9TELE
MPAIVTALAAAHQRMVQKNFFSRKGFSEAGTGTMRGSSRVWASQYAIRSAAALDTWDVEMEGTDMSPDYSQTAEASTREQSGSYRRGGDKWRAEEQLQQWDVQGSGIYTEERAI